MRYLLDEQLTDLFFTDRLLLSAERLDMLVLISKIESRVKKMGEGAKV